MAEGTAADADFLSEIMQKYQIEMVYHMAANSDIQKSAASPDIDFVNTFSTTYGLRPLSRSGVKKLFFASTSAVYGEKMGKKLTEDIGELSTYFYYGGAKLASGLLFLRILMNDFDVTIFSFS